MSWDNIANAVGAEHYRGTEPAELDHLYYAGEDMGPVYRPEQTSFRVWAPTASSVSVVIYDSPESQVGWNVQMHPAEAGTWYTRIRGNLHGKCYNYRVRIGRSVREAVDPYARCLTINGRRGMVVDLTKTNPLEWDDDSGVDLESPVDAIVYEVHVRDFSVSPDSGIANSGKYMGFTERGTTGPGGVSTGVDHLLELGITHVHLLPVHDFGSVDEASGGYNWGYDPHHYFVPEGSYSINPAGGPSRILEFKEMVQALHRAGLGVVIDAVYNHTYKVGDSDLDLIVPGYYYRKNSAGQYTDGSGCGNELAAEKPMVRKLILDSVKYWVEEYHVDGFRFDLLALMGVDTAQMVAEELRRIRPGILLYGEPWTGGISGLRHAQLLLKGRQRGMGIALFNDDFRNAIKGDNDGHGRGFATGSRQADHEIRKGIVGSIAYDHSLAGFASSPAETVNYVSCHDNLTLWDKIRKTSPDDSEECRIKMDILAQAVVLVSQGVPFLHAGEEMLRTKNGLHNTYNAGDLVNRIEWGRKAEYREVCEYYRSLIRLRRDHPGLRMRTAYQIREHLRFIDAPPGAIVFEISGHANGDTWGDIVVALNSNRHPVTVDLPGPGSWAIGLDAFRISGSGACIEGTELTVPGISSVVVYKQLVGS